MKTIQMISLFKYRVSPLLANTSGPYCPDVGLHQKFLLERVEPAGPYSPDRKVNLCRGQEATREALL